MEFIGQVLSDAVDALFEFGPELRAVLGLTLLLSSAATVIGVLVGVPLGVALALGRFRGKRSLRVLVNVGMGIPPVLVGLFLLLLFWNSGPFGDLGLVFTPTAMLIAQVLLAIPIAAGVTAGAVGGLPPPALEQLEAAARLEPRSPAIHADIARLYAQQGLALRARREAERALELAPGNEAARTLLAELGGGEAASPQPTDAAPRKKGLKGLFGRRS